MNKVGSPRGLIHYSADNALKNHLSSKQIRQRALRPRVLIYTGILCVIVSIFFGALIMRTPLKLDVIRDRGAMGREVDDGMIENVYRLQIMNTDETRHRYKIAVSGIDTIELVTPNEVSLLGTEARAVPVRIRVAHGKGNPGSNKIQFDLKAMDDERLQVSEKAVFFVPR